MFTFSRDSSKAFVRVDTGLKTSDNYETPIFPFAWECGGEWQAILLVRHLWKKLSEWRIALREEAYRQGWADAKAKRAKQY